MRVVLVTLLLLTGCGSAAAPTMNGAPSPLHDDLVAYATASCFAIQQNAYLRDQGSRWAGAVMQKAHGSVDKWSPIAAAVKDELGRSGIAQGQGDGPAAAPVPLPVMTCGTIAATPPVRHAIADAATALAADYRAGAR